MALIHPDALCRHALDDMHGLSEAQTRRHRRYPKQQFDVVEQLLLVNEGFVHQSCRHHHPTTLPLKMLMLYQILLLR